VLARPGFGVASLAAGTAPDIAVLLAARVGQGVFAGLMAPQALSFIHAEFTQADLTPWQLAVPSCSTALGWASAPHH
jgi:MFS family permease